MNMPIIQVNLKPEEVLALATISHTYLEITVSRKEYLSPRIRGIAQRFHHTAQNFLPLQESIPLSTAQDLAFLLNWFLCTQCLSPLRFLCRAAQRILNTLQGSIPNPWREATLELKPIIILKAQKGNKQAC